jgi:hypothetical protein
MNTSTSLFRLDRFAVPDAALPDFLAQVRRVDALLARERGCRQHLVLVQSEGGSEFNVATLVGWESEQAMSAAKRRMQAIYREEGFDPAAFMKKLGVRPDMAVFRCAA